MLIDKDRLYKELTFKTSRSGGAGGQNVNKVETKVTLIWSIANSELFSAEQKELLSQRLVNKLNKDGNLQFDASDSRSQLQNKDTAFARLLNMLEGALRSSKKRVATKIPKSVVLNRLDRKRKLAAKKAWRSKNFGDD